MVIDFSADWCGPCKFIEPAVHDLATEFSDVEFIKIDVDELPVSSFVNHIIVKIGLFYSVIFLKKTCYRMLLRILKYRRCQRLYWSKKGKNVKGLSVSRKMNFIG